MRAGDLLETQQQGVPPTFTTSAAVRAPMAGHSNGLATAGRQSAGAIFYAIPRMQAANHVYING